MYKAAFRKFFSGNTRVIESHTPGYIGKYVDLFGEKYNGTFVEVGAFDGVTYSNTSCFPILGWKGYYIEPIKEYADHCHNYFEGFNNIQVFNIAISGSNGNVSIKKAGAESSGVTRDYYGVARKLVDRSREVVTVPAQTLNDFLTDNGVVPNFELLVVDVEGMEWEVLRTFNFDYWRPQVMIIELRDIQKIFNGTRVQVDHKKVTALVLSNGYAIYWRDELNTIFRRRSE